MATLEEMIIRLETVGGPRAAQEVRQVAGAVNDADAAGRRAGKGLDVSRAGIMGLAWAADEALSALTIMAGFLATFTGVRTAAQFRDIQLSLEMVTGSAERAAGIMAALKRMGAETPFDTRELAQFAGQLIGAGTAADHVVEQLRTLADLAAYVRVPRAEMGGFLQNILQIRGQPTPQMEDLKQLTRLAPSIGRIVAAGVGQRGRMTSLDAMRKLQTMTGQQAFDVIVRGTEKIAKNAALMAAMLSPISLFANLLEKLQMVMEPTGQILLAVLTPLMALVSSLAGKLLDMNELSRGWAGLALLVGLVARGWFILTGTLAWAKAKVDELTGSLLALSAAAGTASTATAGSAAAQAASSAGGMLGGVRAAMAAGGVRGVGKLAVGGLKGLGARAVGIGAKALKFMKSATGIGMATLGTELLGDYIGGSTGKTLSNVGNLAGWGAMVVGLLGSIVPVIGTAVGAAVGAGIGGLAGLAQSFFTGTPAAAATRDAAAQELRTTNAILRDMKGELIGGGKRTRLAASQVELEIGLARMAAGYG